MTGSVFREVQPGKWLSFGMDEELRGTIHFGWIGR